MRKIRCSILMACFHHLLRNEFGWSSYFTRVFGNSKRIFTSVLVMLVLFCWGFLWYKGNKKQENTHTHKQKTRWWFQTFFILIPTWGIDPIWRAYFSDGLVQPPTRKTWNISSRVWWPFSFNRHISSCSTWKSKITTQVWPYVTLHKWWVLQVQVELAACCDGRCCWDKSYGSHRMHVHIPTWKPSKINHACR